MPDLNPQCESDLFAIQLERRIALLKLLSCVAVSCLSTSFSWAGAPSVKRPRIVSIGGALTEIAWALGAGDHLVGVDTTSLYPPELSKLPSVGYARSLSSEGILALAPTQVVATEEAGPPTVLTQIRSAGIPVHVLPAQHRFEGVLERVEKMGVLLGKPAQAKRLQRQLQAEWHTVRALVQARKTPPPRVLFVLSHSSNQILVGGQHTAADAMLGYAGARNAVQAFTGFKPLTPESLIAAQPDVVLFTDQGLSVIGGIDGALQLPGLAQTPAGQKRRVIALEAMFLLGFGPRTPAAVAALDAAMQKALQS